MTKFLHQMGIIIAAISLIIFQAIYTKTGSLTQYSFLALTISGLIIYLISIALDYFQKDKKLWKK